MKHPHSLPRLFTEKAVGVKVGVYLKRTSICTIPSSTQMIALF